MPEADALYPRRWWTLATLCLSLLIVFVGNSSLNVAIPTLSRVLHASTSELQWVVAAYSLAFAGLLFTAGALGDRFGRKGALQLGLVGFLAAAVLASASTAMWQLIVSRALMGACAAFIMPSTLSILVNVFPPHERAKAIAIWAGVSGGAGAIGPVASGWLLGNFWFGSVFLINVPIIAAALGLGAFLVPRSKDPQQARLDLVGAGLSIVGISSLVYGLIQAPDKGWSSTQTIAAFVLAVIVLVVFVLWESRVEEPMLDMSFFRNPAFSTATGGMILVFLSMFGVMFLITQYFQLILGYSPLSAALRFLPMAPIMMIVSPLTPAIIARLGANRTVAAGMGLVSLGFLSFSFLAVNTSYLYVLLCLFFLVSGIALTMSPMTAAIMSAVPPRRAGAGSAMNDATRELGAALGVAVLGSVAASRYAAGIKTAIGHLAPVDQASARASLGTALQTASRLPKDAAARLTSAADHAFVAGIHFATITGAVLALCASLLVLRFLPRQIAQHGAVHGAIDAAENMAELGIGGIPPVLVDTTNE
ncbi:MAG TPA: DHA2 family efflux MFS transporter permease subunit [Acidimicrobiales bacterium]|nr:DHA2 family efflux MFS transporter permease subunit [Acidimicrobiales bacterium]